MTKTPRKVVEAFLRLTNPSLLNDVDLKMELMLEAAAAGELEPQMYRAVSRYYAAWATIRAAELRYAGSPIFRSNKAREIWSEVRAADFFAAEEFGEDARDSAWALRVWFDERIEEIVECVNLHQKRLSDEYLDVLGEWLTSGFDPEDPQRHQKRVTLVKVILLLREQFGADDYCPPLPTSSLPVPAPRAPKKGVGSKFAHLRTKRPAN
jgi:hypothetical protein